jgi:hypothetical protein
MEAEIERLLEYDWQEMDFEAVETAMRQTVLRMAAQLLERKLNADLSDYLGAFQSCKHCQGQARYAGRKTKPVKTVLGEITLERAYYHCAHCGEGFFPRDKILCIEKTPLSPAVTRMTGTVAAMVSFQESSELLSELADVQVDTKQVERTAECLGEEIALNEQACVGPEQIHPVADTMYLGIDGTGIPIRAQELEGRAGKQPDGSAKTREGKLCVAWTAQSLDAQGIPVRDEGSVSYSAAIESAAMTDTSKLLSQFAQRVMREATRRKFTNAPRMIIIGDGAAWIWNIAGELFPDAIQVVDRFHAKEHLSDVCKIIWGPESLIGKDWLHQRYQELDSGQMQQLLADLQLHAQYYPEVKNCIEYFQRNAHRMRYGYFHEQRICTSSGVVEAGCKVAIGTRLKRAGMHWTVRGANAIIALRCCKLSGRFEQFWERRTEKNAA